jgi:hypothetical protein
LGFPEWEELEQLTVAQKYHLGQRLLYRGLTRVRMAVRGTVNVGDEHSMSSETMKRPGGLNVNTCSQNSENRKGVNQKREEHLHVLLESTSDIIQELPSIVALQLNSLQFTCQSFAVRGAALCESEHENQV